jgi:hypothetical protein
MSEIELLPADDGGEDGDGWRPRLAVDHDSSANELYVIVGEEVGGMVEGVTAEMFELLRRRMEEA